MLRCLDANNSSSLFPGFLINIEGRKERRLEALLLSEAERLPSFSKHRAPDFADGNVEIIHDCKYGGDVDEAQDG